MFSLFFSITHKPSAIYQKIKPKSKEDISPEAKEGINTFMRIKFILSELDQK